MWEALNNLGVCYQSGHGVEADMAKAFEYYDKAARRGHAKAMYNVGLCYYYGNGTEKDHHMAEFWLSKAYQSGKLDAKTEQWIQKVLAK